ncbi:hypothetical protein GCM10028784_02690 [Myceligenerans cantabricum]
MSAAKPFLAPIVVAAVALAGLTSCQDTAFREQIEGKLAESSREALDGADLGAADVSFTGRDATVEASTTTVAAAAGTVVEDVDGVRAVTAVGPDGTVDLDAVAAGETDDDGTDDTTGEEGADDDGTADDDAAGDDASRDDTGSGTEDADADEADDSAGDEDSDDASQESGADGDSGDAKDGSDGDSGKDDSGKDDSVGEPTEKERDDAQDDLVEIPNITFVTESATLTKEGRKVVRQAAEVLDEHPDVQVRIEGHTDSRGAADENLRLSKHRAITVRDRLVDLGVDKDRLSFKGYGESDPLVAPRTFADLEKNRRVEFVVLD